MVSLPPDLARLGDELTAAAARELDARRQRRRRLLLAAASAVAGILSVAVLAPATLGPASHATAPLASVPGWESLDTVIARPPARPPVVAPVGEVRAATHSDQPRPPQQPWRTLG